MDKEIIKAGRSNIMENFSNAFDDVFMGKVIDRIGLNDNLFAKLMDDSKFQNAVKEWIMKSVYTKLNKDG